MRKIISILLCVMLFVIPSISFATDYSALSDDELLRELDQIRVEIEKREFNPDKIICDCDGMVITLSGEIEETVDRDGSIVWSFPIVAVNNSDI